MYSRTAFLCFAAVNIVFCIACALRLIPLALIAAALLTAGLLVVMLDLLTWSHRHRRP